MGSFVLIEPAIVPAVYCSGTIDPIDLGDGNILFTGFAKQQSFSGGDGATDLVVVHRVVMPLSAVILSMRQTASALKLPCFCRAAHARLLVH